MSRILIVNGNLHGHINPTLPVVRELVHRGNEVFYYSTREFRTKIESAGAVFLDYGEEFARFLHSFRPSGNHPFYTLVEYMLALDRAVIPIVLAKAEQMEFNCILHDVMFGGGKILADKLKLPAVGSCSSFILEKPPVPERMLEPGFDPYLDELYRQLSDAVEEWGLATPLTIKDIFFQKESLNLVYTSRYFHPQGEAYDNSYCFVGPSLADRDESMDFVINPIGEKKVIYISLGTVLNDSADFYRKCFEAFRDCPYQIILSVGNKINPGDLAPIPNNFILRNYVPQLEVLKTADIMISHGGLNSVSEALFHIVPVIAIPLANDQPAVAKRITELGAGLELKMEDITPALLRSSVNNILSSPAYQESCRKVSESFQAAGGYHRAAEEILQYITEPHFS